MAKCFVEYVLEKKGEVGTIQENSDTPK